MGGVGGYEAAGNKLGRQEGEVIADRENRRLCMKMIDAGHLHAACGDSEGGVLNRLEFIYGGRLGVGEPGRGGIGVEGFDEGFKSY